MLAKKGGSVDVEKVQIHSQGCHGQTCLAVLRHENQALPDRQGEMNRTNYFLSAGDPLFKLLLILLRMFFTKPPVYMIRHPNST